METDAVNPPWGDMQNANDEGTDRELVLPPTGGFEEMSVHSDPNYSGIILLFQLSRPKHAARFDVMSKRKMTRVKRGDRESHEKRVVGMRG